MSNRTTLVVGAVVGLMVLISAGSALVGRPGPNTFFILWVAEFPILIAAGVVALVALIRDRRNAPGLLAAMTYAVVLAAAFVWGTSTWGATDNSYLGMLALAALLVLMAIPLGLASAVVLLRYQAELVAPARRALLVALGAAVFTLVWFVARGPGDWDTASTSTPLFSFPLIVAACALGTLIVQFGRD